MTVPTQFFADQAWLGEATLAADVLISVDGGRVTDIEVGAEVPSDALVLSGLTMPGMANAHSHAFHRALRGRTHAAKGSFWTWREEMYNIANRLTPDTYFTLATATFREMISAGYTAVGEFHYLHHQPSGEPYDNPNAMSEAVLAAATESGIRITLLDVLYLHGGLDAGEHQPLAPNQLRFGSSNVDAWVTRVSGHSFAANQQLGVAAHSVRAVNAEAIAELANYAQDIPRHIHLSEQMGENQQTLDAYSKTPTQVLGDAGFLGVNTTAVHATHLTPSDRTLIGESKTTSCFCPTTERDLADGVGPSMDLTAAGSPLCFGSDSHAIIDPFEEMRGLEMNERLVSGRRGNHAGQQLAVFASSHGYQSLGWTGGSIGVGQLADFLTIDTGSVRIANGACSLDQVIFGATSADVRTVIVGGVVVSDHAPTTGQAAAEILTPLLSDLLS